MITLAAPPPIHAILEKVIVTLTMIVLEILFVEQTTALLGLLTCIAVKAPVSQKTMTCLAVLPPIHVALVKGIVTLTMIVLEI